MLKKPKTTYEGNKTLVVDWVKNLNESNDSVKRSRSFRASEIDIDKEIEFNKAPCFSENSVPNNTGVGSMVSLCAKY